MKRSRSVPMRQVEIARLASYLAEDRVEQNVQVACAGSWIFTDWLASEDLSEWGVTEAQARKWIDSIEDGQCWELGYAGIFPAAMLEAFRGVGEERLMRDEPTEAPAFLFFSSPQVLDRPWLVHFTDAGGLGFQGFRVGVDDPSKLGLTTMLGQWDKSREGYNFAFEVEHAEKHGRRGFDGEYKYGDNAYLFRVPTALSVWHYGDKEQQAIFWGPSARWIVPLERADDETDGRWGIRHPDSDHWLVVGEFEDIAGWLERNGVQYRRLLFGAAERQRRRRQRRAR